MLNLIITIIIMNGYLLHNRDKDFQRGIISFIRKYVILPRIKLDGFVLASFHCFRGRILYPKNFDATGWT